MAVKYDIYTAVAIQPEVKVVEKRSDIKKFATLPGTYRHSPQTAPSAKEKYEGNWAPIKLVSFPEFFIQGHEGHWPFDHYINEVLIDIPGEETERLAEKPRNTRFILPAVRWKETRTGSMTDTSLTPTLLSGQTGK